MNQTEFRVPVGSKLTVIVENGEIVFRSEPTGRGTTEIELMKTRRWDYGLHSKSIKFVRQMVSTFGNEWILRDNVRDLQYELRIHDLSGVLKNLELRGFCEIKRKGKLNRIDVFRFKSIPTTNPFNTLDL